MDYVTENESGFVPLYLELLVSIGNHFVVSAVFYLGTFSPSETTRNYLKNLSQIFRTYF